MEASIPPVNVYEGNGQLSVAMPLPGAHPQHTIVTVAADRLVVSADCKYPQENQRYLQRGWQVGSWHLDLPLPRLIDPGGAQGTLNLGVLVVMAPLSPSASKESRRLTIT